MQLIFSDGVREDHLYWQAHDCKLFARINKLIDDTTRHPLEGIGLKASANPNPCGTGWPATGRAASTTSTAWCTSPWRTRC